MNKELTKAEEEIMQVLWQIERGVVWDVIDQLPEPKPAYNTVSTFIRILEQKGFLDHEAVSGKTFAYFPVVSREQYRSQVTNKLVDSYFDGSIKELVSFFMQDKNLNLADADEIIALLKSGH